MMKFAIYREIEGGGRKFLLEWDQEQIVVELQKWMGKRHDWRSVEDIPKAFDAIIEKFKKESIKIP